MRVRNLSLLLAVLFICCLQPVHTQLSFTPSDMEVMLKAIDNLFFVASPAKNIEVRKFLRAAFHDCMGGCDASINIFKTDNRGLENYVKQMTEIYETLKKPTNIYSKYFKRFSRADFWALCESRALAWGIKRGGAIPTIIGAPFVAGREAQTVSNTSVNEGPLPNGAGGWADMLQVLQKGLPVLSEEDIVALLGLHGSGIAEMQNSGFKGPWGPSQDKNVVNNRFFISLLNLGFPSSTFTQNLASSAGFPSGPTVPHPSVTPPTNLFQWTNSGQCDSPGKMMLPIDMQIYHSFTPDPTGRTNQGAYCPQGLNKNLTACPGAGYLPLAKKTAKLAWDYAKSNKAFVDKVVAAFIKMLSYVKLPMSPVPYTHGWVCVGTTAKCMGDIFFSGCKGIVPSCRTS